MPPTRRRPRAGSTTDAQRVTTVPVARGAGPLLARGPVEYITPTPRVADRAAATTGVELVAWFAVIAIAVGVRALNLDAAPLLSGESSVALDSWQIVQRLGLTIAPSPLLVYGNALLFIAVGATDASA